MSKLSGRLIALSAWLFCTPSWALPGLGLADSPWPDYGGGLTNTHRTSAIGPAGSVRVIWDYDVPQPAFDFNLPFRQASLGDDGTIYFGVYVSQTGQLTALRPDGAVKWIKTGNSIGWWPAVSASGHVYHEEHFSGHGFGPLYSRNAVDGAVEWTTDESDGPYESGPTVGPDGTIYSAVGGLSAYSPTGALLWRTPATESQFRNPAIALDGTIYVDGQFTLTALDHNGDPLWFYPAGVRLGPVSIDDQGNLYVGSANDLDERLISLTSAGTLRWQRSDIGGVASIGLDGTIYAGYQGTLHALNPGTGQTLWSYDTGDIDEFGVEGVTVDGQGNIYLANREGVVMSLTPAGQLRWQFDLAPNSSEMVFPGAPVIGANGLVYVPGGQTRKFFALGVPEPTPPTLAGFAIAGCLFARSRRTRSPI